MEIDPPEKGGMEKVEQPQAAKRASKPKSRSGCITCKMRHVKCDETKPVCNRCQNFGVVCGGYETPGAAVSQGQMSYPKELTWFSETPQRVVPLTSEPSTGLSSLDEVEGRYFKVFQEKTATELAGLFDADLWKISILQICHTEVFARNAVIALGALYLSYDGLQSSLASSQTSLMPVEHGWKPENQHRQYALEQYSKALHAMRQIFKKKPLSWARNTIISCLLTTYIEAYLGDRDNPFAQAQAGIELIERIEVSNDSTRAEEFGYSSTTPTSLDNDLICIFARFEAIMIWCKEIHKSTGQSHHLRVLPSATFLKEIPSTFNTIKDAKYCWDLSLTRFVRYQIAMSEQAYDKDGESLAEKMPKSPFRTVESTKILRQETERFIKACQQWYQCFSPLLQQAREKPGTHENLGAVSLNGQYLAAFITLSLSAEEAECTCDNFLDEFITIIEDAETVLSSRLWATSKVKLGLDCTVIWRLSMVSMKCRDRVVRRRAIELMRKCAMGEGPRNGAMAAAIATSMMEREEQGVVGDYIPEEARLKVIRTEIILEERKVKIVCSKLVEGSEKKEELPEVTVTWRR